MPTSMTWRGTTAHWRARVHDPRGIRASGTTRVDHGTHGAPAGRAGRAGRTGRVGRVGREVRRAWQASGAWCIALLALDAGASAPVGAAPPAGYYDTVDTSTPQLLRTTLHAVIDDHTKIPYTSPSTDTWDVLELADQDPANAANILDLYRNHSYAKIGGGTGPYNREHTWPNSYGFPTDGAGNYPYTDCHHLFLCDTAYNSDRSNQPYGACSPGATERATEFNGGQGGGSGVFPGNSNWFNGSVWQTWNGRRGDVARAMFYMDVRYEGGTHGITHVAEPDLILTDNASLIVATGGNASVAYMGLLSVLLQWNAADPPDARERTHNDVVYGFQGNRNPFVDHPEWVNAIFLPSTGPTIASIPDVPGDQGGFVQVNWQRNSLDVAGAVVPITQYVIQRLAGSWIDVATQPANRSATYSLAVPTNDIASPADPQPWSHYRVAAIDAGSTPHLSGAVGAYSVDNLPPPAPIVTLDANGDPWVLSWELPAIPDFEAACVYRGESPGFLPTTPVQCGPGASYLEYDLAQHYYVVQVSDIHGNLGDFSEEVAPQLIAAPFAVRIPTGILGIYPNPFNPRTSIALSLGEPGPVRLELFGPDGRFVRTLLDETRPAGTIHLAWDGTDSRGARIASGCYLVRLQAGGEVDTERLLLLK